MLSLSTTPPPAYSPDPTGPMCRLLRKLAAGGRLTAIRTGHHRVLCLLDGHEVPAGTVAGLLARGLLDERATGEGESAYTPTADGLRWAKGVG